MAQFESKISFIKTEELIRIFFHYERISVVLKKTFSSSLKCRIWFACTDSMSAVCVCLSMVPTSNLQHLESASHTLCIDFMPHYMMCLTSPVKHNVAEKCMLTRTPLMDVMIHYCMYTNKML